MKDNWKPFVYGSLTIIFVVSISLLLSISARESSYYWIVEEKYYKPADRDTIPLISEIHFNIGDSACVQYDTSKTTIGYLEAYRIYIRKYNSKGEWLGSSADIAIDKNIYDTLNIGSRWVRN